MTTTMRASPRRGIGRVALSDLPFLDEGRERESGFLREGERGFIKRQERVWKKWEGFHCKKWKLQGGGEEFY